MSLALLQQSLQEEAGRKAQKIRAELEKRIEEEQQRIAANARIIEENLMTIAQAEGERRARQIHQNAQLTAKAKVLEAKQEELDATVAAAVQHVLSWDSDRTEKFLQYLLEKLPADSSGEIIPGELHASALQKLMANSAVRLSDERIKDDGGFVFRGEQTEIHMTVRGLVSDIVRRHRTDIAKALFG